MEVPKVLFSGTARHPDGLRLQHERRSEGKWDLEFIPALQLDLMFHRNVKAKNRCAGLEGEQDWALLRDVSRDAGSIDRERAVHAPSDFTGHLGQSPKATARTRAARGA